MSATTIESLQTEGRNCNPQKAGFTLIELSIVLVIIGLIVGGVLVGQDLIKAAEIRATISQYEKYNAALNTFRTKYDGMPGDLLYTTANSFAINPTAGSLTSAAGDGNGLIESTATTNYNLPLRENVLIWQQLNMANLVDGSYGTDLTVAGAPAVTTPSTYLPAAKLGRGNYWAVGSAGGLNHYALINPTAFAAAGASYTVATGGGVTPIEAFNIDSKLDDGMPNTGIVRAKGETASAATADAFFPDAVYGTASLAGATATCTTGNATSSTSTNTYNRATYGNTPSCALRLRFN